MAAIELMQSTPAPSSPNAGGASVRQSSQASRPAPATEKALQQYGQQGSEKRVTAEELQKAVQEANVEMASSNESISFGYEEKLGMLYVQVMDNDSGEVVREIPSKEFIAHRVAMREMIGLLLDKQA